jgi:cobalt-zinc-cadmium efflux system outer membrane protein
LTSLLELREELGDGGLDEAARLVEIARVAYEEGEIGIVELLDAADAYLDARLMNGAVHAEGWLAHFELQRAVGGMPTSRSGGNR